MDALRVVIKALTTSFRYPMFAVSYQPTYKIPPVSTIYGLLSAAKGEKVYLHDIKLGYTFTSKGSGIDLERILEFGGSTKTKPGYYQKSNVIWREFLFDCTMYLYILDLSFIKYLIKPYYTLVLGRQTDLAIIEEISTVALEERKNIEISNTMIPFDNVELSGQIVSLPSDFTDTADRKALDVKPYCIIETKQIIEKGLYDPELNLGIYIYDFTYKS